MPTVTIVDSTDTAILFSYPDNGQIKEIALDPIELDVHLHRAYKTKTDDEDPAWIIDFRNRIREAYKINFTSRDALSLVDAINDTLDDLKKTPDDMPSSPDTTE